jgi:DNA-directed RNA polymerase subunit RPC12/RpoP
MEQKCPSSDISVTHPKEVKELPCTQCGATLEFFGDDRYVKCHECGAKVTNPNLEEIEKHVP